MALHPTPALPQPMAGRSWLFTPRRKAGLQAGLAMGSLLLLGLPWLVPGEGWAQGVEKGVSPGPSRPAQADGAGPLAPSPPVQEVVDLVQRAAEAVRQQGEASFDAFRRRGGPWFQGENYVVVLGSDGRSVVYPPDRRGEGLNYEEFEDIGGKPFGRQFLAVGDTPTGRGWVHYQWRRPNPADRRPVWKATYLERVTAPSGRGYLVLSGLYEPPMEPLFVVDAVEGASRQLQRQGREAFPVLRDPRGPFFYQDTYVFVLAADGRMLLNPAFPALEGRSLESWPDPGDRSRLRASLQKVLQSGSTWITYRWPRPGSTVPVEAKRTYLRTVKGPGGEVWLVGSGLYVLP